MGLLNSDNLTNAEKKARRIDNRINNAFRILDEALRLSVQDIYGDPSETQAVLDAWETGAVKRFQLSNIAFEARNAAVAVTGEGEPLPGVIPADHAVTLNPNGSATDTYTPPQSSSSSSSTPEPTEATPETSSSSSGVA